MCDQAIERKFLKGFYSECNTVAACCAVCAKIGIAGGRFISDKKAGSCSSDTSLLAVGIDGAGFFHCGEAGLGELGLGPKRKTGARRGEVWPGNLSAERYVWPLRECVGSTGSIRGREIFQQNNTRDERCGARACI